MYPDHGFKRIEKQISLSWNNGYLPKLHNDFWWLKKWADRDTYVQYRACVNTLVLVYNTWTNLLRIHFTYKTWFWMPKIWSYV